MSWSRPIEELIGAITVGDMPGTIACLNNGTIENIDELGKTGQSPLAIACIIGNADIVELLLMRGASVENEGAGGMHPIHWAAQVEDSKCLKLLIKANSNVDLKTNHSDQRTPLMLAALGRNVECVKLLLENKADPTLVDRNGLNALDIAKAANLASKQKKFAQFLPSDFSDIIALLTSAMPQKQSRPQGRGDGKG